MSLIRVDVTPNQNTIEVKWECISNLNVWVRANLNSPNGVQLTVTTPIPDIYHINIGNIAADTLLYYEYVYTYESYIVNKSGYIRLHHTDFENQVTTSLTGIDTSLTGIDTSLTDFESRITTSLTDIDTSLTDIITAVSGLHSLTQEDFATFMNGLPQHVKDTLKTNLVSLTSIASQILDLERADQISENGFLISRKENTGEVLLRKPVSGNIKIRNVHIGQ